VAEMQRSIGIRQGAGDENGSLCHSSLCGIWLLIVPQCTPWHTA
jgi:hypothetical protein